MTTTTTQVSTVEDLNEVHDYAALEALVARRLAAAKGPLFTTDAASLFDTFLGALPVNKRQHYNCRCCRRFLDSYGDLVTIDGTGKAISLLWHALDRDPPDFFFQGIRLMCERVGRAKVTGVFLSGAEILGTPEAGGWTHLHGPNPCRAGDQLKTANQLIAEKKQDYITLKTALNDFPAEALCQAVRVLEADALDRGEKTLGAAKWLFNLKQRLECVEGSRLYDNLVWLTAATAPPGWCHVRSTMIGTLLEDITAGLPYETVARRWREKMHPLRYQRPTALKDGAVKQANELVEKLGAAGALRRRFARLEEVIQYALWRPRGVPEPKGFKRPGGVFDHLLSTKQSGRVAVLELPCRIVTWEKFRDVVLPIAYKLEVLMPHGRASFCGLVTAADPEAPPLLQWDGLVERDTDPHGTATPLPRNPVSWYFHHGGSTAERWGLTPGEWVHVNAVLPSPAHFQRPNQFDHVAQTAVFVLEGCRDDRFDVHGGFFPEFLRNNYHGVRQVLEAHARRTTVEGAAEGTANGWAIQRLGGRYQADFNLKIRVTNESDETSLWKIDR